jgi:hypothetical protein
VSFEVNGKRGDCFRLGPGKSGNESQVADLAAHSRKTGGAALMKVL